MEHLTVVTSCKFLNSDHGLVNWPTIQSVFVQTFLRRFFFDARLDFPSSPLSAPGSPRMHIFSPRLFTHYPPSLALMLEEKNCDVIWIHWQTKLCSFLCVRGRVGMSPVNASLVYVCFSSVFVFVLVILQGFSIQLS